MVADCTATSDRICAPCSELPLCDVGSFREGCGHGNEGRCVPCRGTQPGYYRVDCGPPAFPLEGGHVVKCDECEAEFYRDKCGGLSEGECKKCEDCGADYWRDGCGTPWSVWIYPGDCKQCQDCGENRFLTGCQYLEPGKCTDCTQCSPTQYMVTECAKTADRICAPCPSLPACEEGQRCCRCWPIMASSAHGWEAG